MAEGVKADSYIVRTGRETGDVEKCKADPEIVKVRVSKDIQPQDHVCMEPVRRHRVRKGRQSHGVRLHAGAF